MYDAVWSGQLRQNYFHLWTSPPILDLSETGRQPRPTMIFQPAAATSCTTFRPPSVGMASVKETSGFVTWNLPLLVVDMSYSLFRLECSDDAEDVDQEKNIRHPYTFHIGASWSEKFMRFSLRRDPHPSDTWRDHMLKTSTRKVEKKVPGQDFFFIQKVNYCRLRTFPMRTLS